MPETKILHQNFQFSKTNRHRYSLNPLHIEKFASILTLDLIEKIVSLVIRFTLYLTPINPSELVFGITRRFKKHILHAENNK
jgi:hypothetical protein